MKCHLLIAALLVATAIQAQMPDSIDNIILQIPKNWHADKQPEFTQLTSYSKERFCQLAIYQKQAASADKKASFEREWSNLVLASFDAAATASPQAKKLRNGQSVLSFGAQAVNRSNNQPCYVELNMFDCGKTVQSAMVVSANKQHLQFFDSSWQSLIASVKSSGDEGVVAIAKFPLTGEWSRSSADLKCQYDFKPNGDYTFHSENRTGNDLTVIEESGSYSIIDTQLVVMPAKSRLQQLDKNGKVIKSSPGDISRRIYTWAWQDPQYKIVLQPAKQYLHDGQTGGITLSKGTVK